MKVTIIDQPQGAKTGELLRALLQDAVNGKYNEVVLLSAFAKRAGVARVQAALAALKASSSTLTTIVGVDHNGTSKEAVDDLFKLSDRLFIVHSTRPDVTFHPKAYLFKGATCATLLIGSSNLTAGGLFSNMELSVELTFDLPADATELANATPWVTSLSDSSQPYIEEVTSQNLSAMLACLPNEVSIAATFTAAATSHGSSGSNSGLNTFFGAGNFSAAPSVPSSNFGATAPSPQTAASTPAAPAAGSAPPPSTSTSPTSPVVVIPHSDEGETIWFETRRMTGGSRNILDLSKRSLVTRGNPAGTRFDLADPRFMRGAVTFFGLNPADTHRTKNVIVNFEGIEYAGNTILFPVGNKANGTWRLQIKGNSPSGSAITDAFRSKAPEYLVNKIITFTRATNNYYYMSVFAASKIKAFETMSTILARNGETNSARRLGLL